MATTKVQAPTTIIDYHTKKPITGPVAVRKMQRINCILQQEPQDTAAQQAEVWFRVATISGILPPLRG